MSAEINVNPDGQFVINNMEAKALQKVFRATDKQIDKLLRQAKKLKNQDAYNLLCLEIDLIREAMNDLSVLRDDIWQFVFEADPDEI